jgi:nitroimidazol reductase NimA-like FMN-containing flavoprotein (pyridoxamine 5'-phosphate oxidase superfamily)
MMRRKDKEITDRDVIDSIIRRAPVCRLAMVEGGLPYVILLCFGYEADTLYFILQPRAGSWRSCIRTPRYVSRWISIKSRLAKNSPCAARPHSEDAKIIPILGGFVLWNS